MRRSGNANKTASLGQPGKVGKLDRRAPCAQNHQPGDRPYQRINVSRVVAGDVCFFCAVKMDCDNVLLSRSIFCFLRRGPLPADADYLNMSGLRIEARQKLDKQRPASLGQASRIPGVSPGDITVLMIWLKSLGCRPEEDE